MPPLVVVPSAVLLAGTLIARSDRFVATVRLDSGEVVESHCVNPGRMEAFVDPGARVYLQPASGKGAAARRCQYTWELIERTGADGAAVICGANTQRPNALAKELILSRTLAGLADWVECKPEFSLRADHGGKASSSGSSMSRIDFLLVGADGRRHFVEVKNCHLVLKDGWGYFPDSVSERASRHVAELAALCEAGAAATVLLIVQRGDVVHGVRPSDFHDPTFAAAVRSAAAVGVRFRAVRAEVGLSATTLTHEIPVQLQPYDLTSVATEWEANRPTTGWIRSASGKLVANGPFPHHLTKRAIERGAPGARPKDAAPKPSKGKSGTATRKRRVEAPTETSAEAEAPPESAMAVAVKSEVQHTPARPPIVRRAKTTGARKSRHGARPPSARLSTSQGSSGVRAAVRAEETQDGPSVAEACERVTLGQAPVGEDITEDGQPLVLASDSVHTPYHKLRSSRFF